VASQAILETKKAVVSEISEKMKQASSFVIVEYQGLTVALANALRTQAKSAGVEYKIYKNTYCRFAAKECGYDGLEEILVGPNAIAFSADSVAPARLIADFAKENRLQNLKFKGGVIEGRVADAAEVEEISKLPGRDVLLSQMIGSFNAPIAKLAYVIKAIMEQKEESQQE
jgi:large subunit ribosomal protein L10